jgi:hypothetical protein
MLKIKIPALHRQILKQLNNSRFTSTSVLISAILKNRIAGFLI